MLTAIRFISLLFAMLAMATGFAHLLEIPNKMQFNGPEYLTAQQIYRGWAWLGSIIFLSILSSLALVIAVRRTPAYWRLAAIALGALVGTQIVFWIFTYPVNQITQNWTVLPANWDRLRIRWEYSHAASAMLEFIAVVALILLMLRYEPRRSVGAHS